jgi:hypothetical protein
MTIGQCCFFAIDISSADSNTCTGLTIGLPMACARVLGEIRVSSCQRYGAGGANYANGLAYIDLAASPQLIKFHSFNACTDGQAVEIHLTGMYEVA